MNIKKILKKKYYLKKNFLNQNLMKIKSNFNFSLIELSIRWKNNIKIRLKKLPGNYR